MIAGAYHNRVDHSISQWINLYLALGIAKSPSNFFKLANLQSLSSCMVSIRECVFFLCFFLSLDLELDLDLDLSRLYQHHSCTRLRILCVTVFGFQFLAVSVDPLHLFRMNSIQRRVQSSGDRLADLTLI